MSDPILALLIETARPEIERFVRELVEHELAAVAVPELDVWMTTTEAAHYLRLSPEALRARVRRGLRSLPTVTSTAGSSIATNSTITFGTATRTAATLPPDNN